MHTHIYMQKEKRIFFSILKKTLTKIGWHKVPPHIKFLPSPSPSFTISYDFWKKFLMFIFERERETQSVSGEGVEKEGERDTECEWGRGRERGRHRIWSGLQAQSCQHRAWCGAWTHKLWDRDLSWSQMLNWLSHPGAPRNGPLWQHPTQLEKLGAQSHALTFSLWEK